MAKDFSSCEMYLTYQDFSYKPILIYLLTLFILGGGGDFPPPPQAVRRTFKYEGKVRGSCNYTLNSSFVITEHLKLVSVKKKFPTASGRTLKFGG